MATLRDVARNPQHENRLFAERLESEVTSEYMLLALIAEMSMSQQRQELGRRYAQHAASSEWAEEVAAMEAVLRTPVYTPIRTFSRRTRAIESAKEKLRQFTIVGPQRPLGDQII